MRAFIKAAAMAAALAFAATFAAPLVALAQDVVSSASSAVDSSIVAVSVSDAVNPWLNILTDLVNLGAIGTLLGVVVKLLPSWAQTFVRKAMAPYIEQGILWAIQEVIDFDKDKVISFDVGSEGVAAALRIILQEAPGWLVRLAGGREAIVNWVIAWLGKFGIVLDAETQPAQVASVALKLA